MGDGCCTSRSFVLAYHVWLSVPLFLNVTDVTMEKNTRLSSKCPNYVLGFFAIFKAGLQSFLPLLNLGFK